MKPLIKLTTILSIILFIIIFTACQKTESVLDEQEPAETTELEIEKTTENPEDEIASLANPAAVYCEEKGGQLENRQNDYGVYGVCIFEDKSECGQWAYFREECQPGQYEKFTPELSLPNPEETKTDEQPVNNENTKTENPEELTIKIHFGDTQAISQTACFKTLATERNIPYTQNIVSQAGTAVRELLAGPTNNESQTMALSIPEGTRLLSITIQDGIAIVDFSEEIQSYGGGSCIAQAIQAQLENTLTQFKGINQVAITVEGQSAGAIEP